MSKSEKKQEVNYRTLFIAEQLVQVMQYPSAGTAQADK